MLIALVLLYLQLSLSLSLSLSLCDLETDVNTAPHLIPPLGLLAVASIIL